MAAPKGNEFWKLRSRHGPNVLFDDPAKLEDACLEYFEVTTNSPLFEDKVAFYEGCASHEPVEKMRPFTIGGLCLFLGIVEMTWREWRKREDLSAIIAWAEGVIREQKFAGAAAGLLNPSIIARDLGLADKQEHTGENGGPIQQKMTVEFVDKNSNT
jgi:hypothetical protein